MRWNDLPPWGQMLVVLGLVVALFYFSYKTYPGFGDMRQEIENLDTRVSELQREIKQGKTAKKSLDRLKEEVERLEYELATLVEILPAEKETEEVLGKVKSLADSSYLDLKSFSDRGLQETGDVYKAHSVDLDIEGSYHNLVNFFYKISSLDRIVNISTVNVGGQYKSADKTLKASCTASTFVYAGDVAENAENGQE